MTREELWFEHSRLIPEDAEGEAEEIAETVAGKRIMFENDFYDAITQQTAIGFCLDDVS